VKEQKATAYPIKVSSNGDICRSKGRAVFGWRYGLASFASIQEEAETYLANRSAKGFTVSNVSGWGAEAASRLESPVQLRRRKALARRRPGDAKRRLFQVRDDLAAFAGREG